MNKLLTLFFAIGILGNTYANCLDSYNDKIKHLSGKRVVFKPENGSNGLVGIAQAIGATAVGITAGGVAGFIVPYAVGGIATAVTAVATGVPGALTGMAVGAIGDSMSYEPVHSSTFMNDNSGLMAGAGMGFVVGDLILASQIGGTFAPIAKSVLPHVVGAVMPALSTVTSVFVPAGMILGGAVGLTVGVRDAILNYKIFNFNKAKNLIQSAIVATEENDEALFLDSYNKLKRKLRKMYSPLEIAEEVAYINDAGLFCRNGLKPQKYKKIQKTLITNLLESDTSNVEDVSDNSQDVDMTQLIEVEISNFVDANLTYNLQN